MRRTIIALMLFVSGAGAAVAQPAKQNPPEEAPQRGHCAVGVVSNLGEKFRVEEVRLLTTTVKVSEVPVESWHLDDLVVDKIRRALGKQAAVQRIRYRKEAFATRKVFWWEAPDYATTIRRLATGTRCARYLFVIEGRVSDGVDDDMGIGIRRHFLASAQLDRGFGSGVMYAVIEVKVYDGKTFKLLGRRVDKSARGSVRIFAAAHPKRLVDESFWPVPPSRAEQNAKLREVTRELLAECLDKTLPRLPLTP